jgi:hypothetical protein
MGLSDDAAAAGIPQLPVPSYKTPGLDPEIPDPPLDVSVSWSTADWDAHRARQRAVKDSNDVKRRAHIKESNRVIRANELARAAHERGVNETLEQVIPNIIDTVLRVQDLTAQSMDLVAEAMESRDLDLLRAATPVMKTLVGEANKLLDRVAGRAVQRQEIKQDSHNTNVNVDIQASVTMTLDELVAMRQNTIDPSEVVDAEVIG